MTPLSDEFKARLLAVIHERPGYHVIWMPWRYLFPSRFKYIRAIWQLWRHGHIRVDGWLHLWPKPEGDTTNV